MPVSTRSGKVLHPPTARRARARGRYHGRGHFSSYTRSISSSSSEEALQSPSPVRSPRRHMMEFFPKDPFQSQHIDTDDREIEPGNHSRQCDIPRTDRERETMTLMKKMKRWKSSLNISKNVVKIKISKKSWTFS